VIERDFTLEDFADVYADEAVCCEECGDPLEDAELLHGSRCEECRIWVPQRIRDRCGSAR
jgi:hypothetical protein